MEFEDRREAGRLLGEALAQRTFVDDVTVYGIPRGGVIVAAQVAQVLGVPLDVAVVRKLGAPDEPELGIGAIAQGVVVVDEDALRLLRVSREHLAQEIAAQETELARRVEAYRIHPQDPADRTAVIVDDGIATGGTAVAAARWARLGGAATVVIAVPTASPRALDYLRAEADEVIVLDAPERFRSVGGFYRNFAQTTDDEVRAALANR